MNDKLIKLLKQSTLYAYSDLFYEKLSTKIENLYSDREDYGYVYFVQNGQNDNNYVKIGVAKDLSNRMRSFSTSFDNQPFLIGYIKTKDPYRLEKSLHSLFAKKKVKGEWFNLSLYELSNNKYTDFRYFMNYFKNNYSDLYIEQNSKTEIADASNDIFVKICLSLKYNENYITKDLYEKNKSDLENPNIGTRHFGKHLSKAMKLLGYERVDFKKDGVRYWKIIK